MDKTQVISRGYANAGDDFLAEKLKKIFCPINTEEDRYLHNEMIRDLMMLIGPEISNVRKSIARTIFSCSFRDFNQFVKRMAQDIRNIGAKNAKT